MNFLDIALDQTINCSFKPTEELYSTAMSSDDAFGPTNPRKFSNGNKVEVF